MAKQSPSNQPSPKKNGLILVTDSSAEFDLWEYPFPATKGERFSLFVDGVRTEGARTQGVGNKGDVRHYRQEGAAMQMQREALG